MAPIARLGGGRRTAAAVLAACIGVAATACGSSSRHAPTGPTTTAARTATTGPTSSPPTSKVTTSVTNAPPSSPSSAPSTRPPAPSSTDSAPTSLLLSEAANGTTATAAVGATITVVLHSTYWTFAPPSPPVLAADGVPTPRPGDGCGPTVPGSGCGTVTLVVRAAAPGTAAVSAARTSCGEALRCSPAQSAWSATIRVT
jgi:hypothetical protein